MKKNLTGMDRLVADAIRGGWRYEEQKPVLHGLYGEWTVRNYLGSKLVLHKELYINDDKFWHAVRKQRIKKPDIEYDTDRHARLYNVVYGDFKPKAFYKFFDFAISQRS